MSNRITLTAAGKGNPALDLSAAGAGGAVPVGTVSAAAAPMPQGYLVQFALRPDDNHLPPRITAYGKERGAGRVTLVFDADARAILRTVSPSEFFNLLYDQIEKMMFDEYGKATAAWQEIWLDPNTPQHD